MTLDYESSLRRSQTGDIDWGNLTPIDHILSELQRNYDDMMWEGVEEEVNLKRALERIDHYQSERDKGVIYEPNF
jgi:hypothetical protein